MSKIKIKDVKEVSVQGTLVKATSATVDEMDSTERRKVSLDKLSKVFQFNLYCRREIEAMISNYNYSVDSKVRKKLDFYKIVEDEKRAKTLSAANINSVVAMGDAFLLNAQLQDFETKLLNDTLAINFSDKFSIDRTVLKKFILDTIYDEDEFYDIAFNLEESVRLAFTYVYKSRVARSKLM